MTESRSQAACRFQSFSEPSDPTQVAPRVAALRAALAKQSLDGFIIPRADEHQGEYVPAHMARLAWLTGFTGSAGNAIVLADKAALIVDGRYTIQSAAQTDTAVVTPTKMEETPLDKWVEANLPAGAKLGYDPWLHTVDGVAKLEKAVAAAGGMLVPVTPNPIDALWSDRPAPPTAPVKAHAAVYAGESSASKLVRIQQEPPRPRSMRSSFRIRMRWPGPSTSAAAMSSTRHCRSAMPSCHAKAGRPFSWRQKRSPTRPATPSARSARSPHPRRWSSNSRRSAPPRRRYGSIPARRPPRSPR